MTKQEFQEAVRARVLILDGATGSNLLKRGMPYGVCPELWVTEHPQVMEQLQEEYIAKGSAIIYAPTFSGNRIKLKEYGLLERMEELNRTLVEISKRAAKGNAWVAGDLTMTGAQLEPMGNLTFDELVEIYQEQISIMVDAGVDLLVVETMMSLQETRAAVIAARTVCDLPVMATLSFQENGKTLYGVSAKAAAVVLEGLGVVAVGFNCSAGPDRMLPVLKEMKQYASIPLIAKPNAGMPKLLPDGTTGYDMGPKVFADHMEQMLSAGADLVGGCCGSAPEFIGMLAEAVKKQAAEREMAVNARQGAQAAAFADQAGNAGAEKAVPSTEAVLYLATEREVYAFEPGQELQVGRAIDFSQDAELLEEYQEDCFDTAIDLAFDMEEEGAELICIRTTVTGISEAEAALALAEELARNVNLPLALSADSVETIAYVLRHFSGIIAIQWNHNLEEWKSEIKSIAGSYGVPLVTLDNKIVNC